MDSCLSHTILWISFLVTVIHTVNVTGTQRCRIKINKWWNKEPYLTTYKYCTYGGCDSIGNNVYLNCCSSSKPPNVEGRKICKVKNNRPQDETPYFHTHEVCDHGCCDSVGDDVYLSCCSSSTQPIIEGREICKIGYSWSSKLHTHEICDYGCCDPIRNDTYSKCCTPSFLTTTRPLVITKSTNKIQNEGNTFPPSNLMGRQKCLIKQIVWWNKEPYSARYKDCTYGCCDYIGNARSGNDVYLNCCSSSKPPNIEGRKICKIKNNRPQDETPYYHTHEACNHGCCDSVGDDVYLSCCPSSRPTQPIIEGREICKIGSTSWHTHKICDYGCCDPLSNDTYSRCCIPSSLTTTRPLVITKSTNKIQNEGNTFPPLNLIGRQKCLIKQIVWWNKEPYYIYKDCTYGCCDYIGNDHSGNNVYLNCCPYSKPPIIEGREICKIGSLRNERYTHKVCDYGCCDPVRNDTYRRCCIPSKPLNAEEARTQCKLKDNEYWSIEPYRYRYAHCEHSCCDFVGDGIHLSCCPSSNPPNVEGREICKIRQNNDTYYHKHKVCDYGCCDPAIDPAMNDTYKHKLEDVYERCCSFSEATKITSTTTESTYEKQNSSQVNSFAIYTGIGGGSVLLLTCGLILLWYCITGKRKTLQRTQRLQPEIGNRPISSSHLQAGVYGIENNGANTSPTEQPEPLQHSSSTPLVPPPKYSTFDKHNPTPPPYSSLYRPAESCTTSGTRRSSTVIPQTQQLRLTNYQGQARLARNQRQAFTFSPFYFYPSNKAIIVVSPCRDVSSHLD